MPRGRRSSRRYLSQSEIWAHGPAVRRGEGDRLRLPYRVLLKEQKFVVIHAHVSELQLEAATVHALHPANTECPTCKGKGEVPQHGGLRQKNLSTMQRPRLDQSNAEPLERRTRA